MRGLVITGRRGGGAVTFVLNITIVAAAPRWRNEMSRSKWVSVGSDVTLACLTASAAPVNTRWFFRDFDNFQYHEITADTDTVCFA